MGYQAVFKRYELKYLLTWEQKREILRAMEGHMALDGYGRSTIRNIYFDTDDYRMVRHSLEKPVYKEKLRLRSYQQAQPDLPIFVELKKKYRSVVYKRRIALPEQEAMAWLCRGAEPEAHTQIRAEVDYVLQYYKTLHPVMFLSYEREAYFPLDDSDFRVTFDENLLARTDGLSLGLAPGGASLIGEDMTLMEIKTPGGIPLWMTHALTRQRVYKTSFSKYGIAYQNLIFNGGIHDDSVLLPGRV